MELIWHQPDERFAGREDASWYVWQSADLVVTVVSQRTGAEVEVRANGEMRYIANDQNDERRGVIRYCDDLPEYGIVDDTTLFDRLNSDELFATPFLTPVRFVNVDSPWFEIFDSDGESYMVCHQLTEAISAATALLEKQKEGTE